MPGSTLPSVEDNVFYVADSITIDAPIEKVWNALLDFASYPAWNPFVYVQGFYGELVDKRAKRLTCNCRRYQVLVDPNDVPVEDQTIKEGALLYLKANLPPSMEPRLIAGSTRGVVSHLDHENYRVAWKERQSWTAWFLRFERWQWLTVIEDESSRKTKYENLEVFNGPAAYAVKWIVGPFLRSGVKAMAETLKIRAENAT